jgi:hypothetical protein
MKASLTNNCGLRWAFRLFRGVLIVIGAILGLIARFI